MLVLEYYYNSSHGFQFLIQTQSFTVSLLIAYEYNIVFRVLLPLPLQETYITGKLMHIIYILHIILYTQYMIYDKLA
jgi:hypothetical protein